MGIGGCAVHDCDRGQRGFMTHACTLRNKQYRLFTWLVPFPLCAAHRIVCCNVTASDLPVVRMYVSCCEYVFMVNHSALYSCTAQILNMQTLRGLCYLQNLGVLPLNVTVASSCAMPPSGSTYMPLLCAVSMSMLVLMLTMTPGGSAADGYPRHGEDLVPQAHVLQIPVEPDSAHPLLPQGVYLSFIVCSVPDSEVLPYARGRG